MSKTKAVVLGIVTALVVGYFVVLRLFAPGYLQQVIPLVETTAAGYVNGKIHIEALNISDALELTATNVAVYDNGDRPVFVAPTVKIGFDLLRGLFKADPIQAVSTIDVNEPIFYLRMDENEHWNIKDVWKKTEPAENKFFGNIRIHSGRSEVTTPYGNWNIGVEGTIGAAANPKYDLDLVLSLAEERWGIKGRVDGEARGSLLLKTEHFALSSFSALAKRYIEIEQLSGAAKDLNLRWTNDGKDIALEGSGYLEKAGAFLTYEKEPIPLVLDGKVSFHEKTAKAENLNFTAAGEKGMLNGEIDFSDTAEPAAKDLSVELFAFDLQKVWAPSAVDGKLNGTVTVSGTQKAFDANGVLESEVLTASGETFTKVHVPVSAKNKKIMIPGAQAGYGGGQIFLFGEYEQATGELTADLQAEGVDIAGAAGLSEEQMVLSGEIAVTGIAKADRLTLNTIGKMATLNWRDEVFSNLRLDVDFDRSGLIVNNFSGFYKEDGSIVAEGSIRNDVIDMRTRLGNMPLGPFLGLAGQEGYGKFSGDFVITGAKDAPKIAGAASLSDAKVLGQEIQVARGLFEWQNKRLKIDGLNLQMAAGEHLVNGWVDLNGAEPVVDLKIVTKGVRVEPLAAAFAPEMAITGNLENEMTVRGAISSPEVYGRMNFHEGSFNKYLIDDAVGEYSYVGGNLYLKNFVIHALQAAIELNGNVYANKNLDFALKASKVDLKRLPIPEDKVTVSGLVDLKGTVKGTLASPVFLGDLSAKSVIINGQEFTDISSNLESIGGRVNKLKGSARQGASGSYEIDMLLDFDTALLQGNITAKGGNMKSLLNLAGQDLDVEGALDGNIIVNKGGKGTGISVAGQIRDCRIRGIQYQSVVFDVFLHQDVLQIIKMRAEEANKQGFLAAQGTIDFRNRNLALEMFCSDANAALLTAFMKKPVDFGGRMSFAAQINGTIENPEANGSLEIKNGEVAGTSFDNLYGMFTLRDDMYNIEQLLIQKDIYKASAYGVLPQDLFRAKADRRNPDAQMGITVKLDNANLAILPLLTKNVEWSSGETKGGLTLTGTLEEPLVNGSFNISNGTVKIKQVKTLIENLKLDVNFDGRRLQLQEFSAKIGEKGKLTANGTFALTEEESDPYRLDVTADNVEIASSLFSGIINGKGSVEQKRNRPHIAGEVRFDKVLINLPVIPEVTPSTLNIGLDVKVVLGPEIHLYNKYLYDLWLAGGLHIKGSTRYTNVDGSVFATKGTINYLRTPFKIRKATAGFPDPGSVLPTINLDSYTKFGRYNVTMKIEGPLDQMDLKLTSDPPLTQQELFRMLTLKSYSSGSGSNALGSQDLQGLVDVGLEMTFLRDVETLFKEELKLDQFRVYSGNVATGIGFEIDAKDSSEFNREERQQYNVLVSKYLTDKLLVGYASSLNGEHHNVFTQYELTDKLKLNFSLNEDQKKWYGIEYQISF